MSWAGERPWGSWTASPTWWISLLLRVVLIVGSAVAGAAAGEAATPSVHVGQHAPMLLPAYGQPGSPIRLDPEPSPEPDARAPDGADTKRFGDPVADEAVFGHVLLDQLEGRTNGKETGLRWEGQAWVGTDYNRIWLKSEGFVQNGVVDDGLTWLEYSRPIPFLRYFDWQAGVRYDLDSAPGRLWGAVGIEGLAPGFFELEATFFFREAGHLAGRLEASYDVLITNRLIVQPQAELNFYSKDDRPRAIGSGLSEIDTGLRLRYEISRKFAPYVGITYTGQYGDTRRFVRAEGDLVDDVRFVFGVRLWY